MKLRTLGKLQLEESDFTRQKPLLLLCYLAIEGPQSRRVLADLFFYESKNPRDALSTSYRRLKKLNLVATENNQISTTIACDSNDLLKELEQHNYQAALGLYSGSFLTGLDIALGEELEEWVFATREYLASNIRQAQFACAEQFLKQNEFKEATQLVEQALRLEGAAELEPNDYVRAYAVLSLTQSPLTASLKAEAEAFGIELTHTAKSILSSEKSTLTPHNLVAASSSFVGRDPELLELASLVNETHVRLVTLHGPGGVGKSRLATQLAFNQLQEGKFKDGIFFIPLADLSLTEAIPNAIATTLNISLTAKPEALEQLISSLQDKHMLLILDNFEHLMTGLDLVATMLTNCPALKLLVTSRERLQLEEEHIFSLSGLALRTDLENYDKVIYSDALQLLSQRAKKSKLEFELTSELIPYAVELCQLLEGSPLGIELAMAWIRVMPLEEILLEVKKNSDFLEASTKNKMLRHKSLRAVFENSWCLLSAKEQLVFAKLSVFKGGFKREAASNIASATLTTLVSLVDKSLLKALPNGRYAKHEMLYQFGLEKLADLAELKDQTKLLHASYFKDFVEKASSGLRSEEQALNLTRIAEEYENLTTALSFCLTSKNTPLGLEIVTSLGSYWEMQGLFQEGRTWSSKYLEHSKAIPESLSYANALSNAGWLAFLQGDYTQATLFTKKSLTVSKKLNDLQGTANSLSGLGIFLSDQGDHKSAQSYFEQSLALNKEQNDQQGIAATLNNLGILHSHLGNYAIAEDYHKQSLSLRKALKDDRGIGFALNNLGLLAHLQSHFTKAELLYLEALGIKQKLADTHGVAGTLDNLSIISAELGNYEKAQTYSFESLNSMLELADNRGIANCLQNIASLRLFEGDLKLACILWAAAEALRESLGIPLNSHDLSKTLSNKLETARETLGDKVFNDYWSTGKHLSLEQAVAYALPKDEVQSAITQTSKNY